LTNVYPNNKNKNKNQNKNKNKNNKVKSKPLELRSRVKTQVEVMGRAGHSIVASVENSFKFALEDNLQFKPLHTPAHWAGPQFIKAKNGESLSLGNPKKSSLSEMFSYLLT
jgi:hypothetical protein